VDVILNQTFAAELNEMADQVDTAIQKYAVLTSHQGAEVVVTFFIKLHSCINVLTPEYPELGTAI